MKRSLVRLDLDEPGRFVLTGAREVIGRDPGCDVALEDKQVSWHHARIELKDDASTFIVDLSSLNGVHVNSVRVARQQLQHLDVIAIGSTKFRFFKGNGYLDSDLISHCS